MLTLSAGISLVALSLTILMAMGAPIEPEGFINFKHYYFSLAPYPQMGDCKASEIYAHVVLLATGLVSATPQPYSIYVGYVYPLDGTPHYTLLHSPGWGPASGAGSWYAIWGNAGGTSESVHGETYAVWNY